MNKKILLGLSLAVLVACNEKTPESAKTPVSEPAAKASENVQPAAPAAPAEPEIPVDETSIFKAIENGDVALLKAAIAKGMDVNATCTIQNDKNTCLISNHKNECSNEGAEVLNPIYLAMIKGNYEIAKTLIEAGADVESVSKPCVYYCEPECSYQIIDDMAVNKIFYPGYSDSATTVYTDDRIRISMFTNLNNGELMLPVDATYPVKDTVPSEAMLLEYFKFAQGRDRLDISRYIIDFVNGDNTFKTALNYAEETNRPKLAEYLTSIGAKKVVKVEKYRLSKKDGTIFEESTCEDVHKVYYSDGSTALTTDECGT